MTKVCSKCGIEKNIECFDYHTKGRDRRHPQCKDCRSKYEAIRYQNNKEVIKARSKQQRPYSYIREYKKKYGLTQEQYENIRVKQGGLCAICKQPKKLVIDHCHKTKKVRGLLCDRCNRAIGQFEDSTILLQNAVKYLES